jgi:tRNA A37 N6-isopentenylltransferase MiaA
MPCHAVLQGLESYNSSDGSTYVQINDELPSHKPSSSSSSKSSNPSIQEEMGPSNQGRVMPVAELFKAADAGNWTIEQWVGASTSRQDLRKWRVLLNWPFGEDNGVYRFNREGNALYGTSMDNRCV